MKKIGLLLLLSLVMGGILLLNLGGGGESDLVDDPAEPGKEEVVGSSATLSGHEGEAKAADVSADSGVAALAEARRSSFETGIQGEIHGQVLDLLSEPVAGASLHLYRSADVRLRGAKAPVLARTESDERGYFRMRGFELDSYVLRVQADGFAVAHKNVQLHAAAPKSVGVRIQLEAGYSMEGVVVDPAGKGIAGAWVNASWARAWGAENLLPEVRSDEEGRFTFSSLPQGKVHVLAWAQGRSLGLSEGDPSRSEPIRVELPEAGPFKIIFNLAEQKEGKAGKPGDVFVRLDMIQMERRLPLPSPLRILKVPTKGECSTLGLCEGKYQIFLNSDEVALERPWRQQTLTVEKPEAKLELNWTPMLPLGGRTTYANGRPAQGIHLLIQGDYGQRFYTAKSDEEGRFAFPARFHAKTRIFVMIKSPGFLFDMSNSKKAYAQVYPGEKEIVLKVARVPLFSGRVVDEEGLPVAGARVWLHPVGRVRGAYSSVSSNEKGEFRISSTQRSETALVLEAHSDSAFCAEPLDLGSKAQASRDGIELRLVDGAWVEGEIVDDKGVGVPGVRVQAFFVPPPKSQSPKKVRRPWERRRDTRNASSNREGRFRILGLPSGAWRISTSSDRIKRGSDPVVQLRVGEKKRGLKLVLGEGLFIEGRLVTDTGKPVAGAYIRAKFDGKVAQGTAGIRASTKSAIDGSFALKGLRAGDFVLTTQLPWELQRDLGMLTRGPDGQRAMRAREQPKVKLLAGTRDYLWKIPLPHFGGIRVRLAQSGPPLKHVQVLLRQGEKSWTFPCKLDQGALSLKRIFAGSYVLTIKSPRFADLTTPVQVTEGQAMDLGLLSLVDLAQVEGRVVDEQGQTMAGVWISLDGRVANLWSTYDITKGLEQFDGRVMTQSNSRGNFRVPIEGQLRVYAFKPGYAPVDVMYRVPDATKGNASKHSKSSGDKKALVLVLQRAGELTVRVPTKVDGQGSRWFIRLDRIKDASTPAGKRDPRSWSRPQRLRKGKPLRFVGLKLGTYELKATNFSRGRGFTDKSVPGVSYHEKFQIQPGTNRLIKIR